MKKVYTDHLFNGLSDRNSGRLFTDLEFNHCSFLSCFLSLAKSPKRRSRVKDVRLSKCDVRGCTIYSAIIEDVVIDGLKTHQLLQTFGAVFRHVTLRGIIGELMIQPLVNPLKPRDEIQRSFDKANAEFYKQTDWALDISEALFEDCDIRCLPAHLIRRDPFSQFVFRRETLLVHDWKQIDLNGTYIPTALEWFLDRGDPDLVLVAGKLSSTYPREVEALHRLRAAGIAEPD